MNKADKNGRAWAKMSELKEGQTVEIDGSFPCMAAGKSVLFRDQGGLYFNCVGGHHYVFMEADDGEHCVGIYRVVVEQSL